MRMTFGAAIAACGILIAGSANAAEPLTAEALSAAYVEKCPESIQVLIDLMTASNAVVEDAENAPAIEDQWLTDPGCGTERDMVFADLLKPEVIADYNALLEQGTDKLQAKLDGDIKTVAEEILQIEPMLQRAKAGKTTRVELANLVLFAEAQNRKKTIEDLIAE
jgi:hypothetical protein